MKNIMFPTMIVDGFFSDPDSVVELAHSLEYRKDAHHNWPGKRTALLNEVAPAFVQKTLERFSSIFYPNSTKPMATVYMMFQKVDPSYGSGWVHTDQYNGTTVSNIVFLDKNPANNSGTTIYKPKGLDSFPKHLDKKSQFYAGELEEDVEAYRLENNAQFEESIVVKNQYNRLISFDAHMHHSANDFTAEERLTLVFFVNDFHVVNDYYPMVRMHNVNY